jgi:hypothetical protein
MLGEVLTVDRLSGVQWAPFAQRTSDGVQNGDLTVGAMVCKKLRKTEHQRLIGRVMVCNQPRFSRPSEPESAHRTSNGVQKRGLTGGNSPTQHAIGQVRVCKNRSFCLILTIADTRWCANGL